MVQHNSNAATATAGHSGGTAFSLKRLWLTARQDAAYNRSNLIKMAGILAFIIAVVWSSCLYPMFHALINEHLIRSTVDKLTDTTLAVFALSGIIFGAYAFADLKPGKPRVTYLMIPSSAAEKFAVRMFRVTAGYAAIFFLVLIVADVLRYLFVTGMGYPDTGSVTLGFFSRIGNDGIYGGLRMMGRYSVTACIYKVLILLFMHSIFIMSGLTYSKLKRGLVAAVLVVLCVVVDIIDMPYNIYYMRTTHPNVVLGAACIMAAMCTAVCYAIAYRTFKRMQITDK